MVTISGKIIDKKSKESLPYANVSISNSSHGTVSNESGEFEFLISSDSKNDTLVISYLGFKTFKEKINLQDDYQVISLEEATTLLDELTVSEKKLSAEEILNKAIDKLLEKSDSSNDFKLKGFFREIHRRDEKVATIIEVAFSVYDNSATHPMQTIDIEEFRKMMSDKMEFKSAKPLFNQNNLMMLFGVSTNFAVLAKHGLKNGKTAWAIGTRPYIIEATSSYDNKPVYIISHSSDDVTLRIIIDANDFSVLRNEYHSKGSSENFKSYFWKYSGDPGTQCGFYETHQIYEYQSFNGKMYPHLFYRSDHSACYDLKEKIVKSRSAGNYQALINQVILNTDPPLDKKNPKRHKGLAGASYEYH